MLRPFPVLRKAYGKESDMSKTRKTYFIRLACRCLMALAVLYVYLFHPSAFDVLSSWNFFSSFSVLHILWGVWVVDMAAQLIPVGKRIAIGSQKLFLFRFQPRKEAINYEALKAHIFDTTKAAYKVFLIWVGMLAILAILYFARILRRNEIFLICVAFYVCDLICVLIWCPFRLIMKNKCCTTCRIFNWDHLMMFSPFLFIPGFYTTSLLLIAFAVWLVWEFCVMLYPERFWEISNIALQCSNCTDKLCTQYCKKLR